MRKQKFSLLLAIGMVISLCVPVVSAYQYEPETMSYEGGASLKCFKISEQEETIINIPEASHTRSGERMSYGSLSTREGTDVTRSIIGSDDRTQVMNTTATPYYGIAYIKTTFTDGSTKPGTGFMISEDVLLTAAHCVYTAGKTVRNIKVYPGRNGNSYTISATGDSVYTDTNYTGSEANWDYAVVTLDSSLGNTTGWFSLYAPSSASSLNGRFIETAGYPSDLAASAVSDNRPMFHSTGSISNVTTYRFGHNADTESGQSGSPIYFYNGTYGYQACGVHTHAGNYARRITSDLFDWLVEEGYIQAD